MTVPTIDEIPYRFPPSILIVPHCHGHIVRTTSEHYCVSNGVRDGAGPAVINIVTNIIIT